MLQQLSVFVENEVGSVAKVTTVLKENSINIRAISAFDSPDYGILRVVVDKPEDAKNLLIQKGFAVKVTEVIAMELKDQPGDLDRVLTILANEQLNLNYIYSFVLREDNAPLMVLNIDHMQKGIDVLLANGIKVYQ